MPSNEILISSSDIALEPAPIQADWIIDGDPQARNRVLSKSQDGAAFTLLWDCTAGAFTWRYDIDETIHVLEGGATLTDASGTRAIEAGDVVFFPAGSVATWRVRNYVRKVAFFRRPGPRPVGLALRAWNKLRPSRMPVAQSPRPRGYGELTPAMA